MEIDYDVSESAVTSSSISFGEHLSWGSDTIGVDDYIDYLGYINTLPEIVVGIIDTGIDLDHEFLKDRIIQIIIQVEAGLKIPKMMINDTNRMQRELLLIIRRIM